MTGFYKIYRASLQAQKSTHKFSLLEAYNWLASNAAWADHRKKVNGKWVTVRKNSIFTSIRQLSLKWNRNRITIERYLDKLKRDNVVISLLYNKPAKTLEIFLNDGGVRLTTSKNQSQPTDSIATIRDNRTGVLEKSMPVPFWVNLISTSKFKDLSHLSTIVYKEEEKDLNTLIHYSRKNKEFNNLEDNSMKQKDNPFTLVPSPSSADLRSENVATAETKKPPSPFLHRIGVPKPYPRDTDSPVLLTDKEVIDLTDSLGGLCLMHQVTALAEYAEDQPRKFKAYKNHARVILNWDSLKQQRGLVFCAFHSDRPGYYPQWIYDKELEKRQKRLELAK